MHFLLVLEKSEAFPCVPIQPVPQAMTSVIGGFQTKDSAVSGTVLEIKCLPRYINIKRPCEAGRLTCSDGIWKGMLPKCGKCFFFVSQKSNCP